MYAHQNIIHFYSRLQGNFIQLIVFTQYLVSQYISSPNMTHAVRFWDTIFIRLINDSRCPPILKLFDQKIREGLNKLVVFTGQYVKAPPKPTSTTKSKH